MHSISSRQASASPRPPACGSQDHLWQELVQRHEPKLKKRLRLALLRLGLSEPQDLVDDLSQEVFHRLLKHHGKSLTQGPARCELTLAAYLGRAAESAVLDRLRYRRAAKRSLRRDFSLSQPWVEAQALRFPDPLSNPEQRAIDREAVLMVLRRLRAAGATALSTS